MRGGRLGFPAVLICRRSNIQNVILPPTGAMVLAAMPSFTGKEGMQMLTIEGLIAVISLVLTAFGLGYAIGRNSNTRE